MKNTMIVENISQEVKGSFEGFTSNLERELGVLSPAALQALGAVPGSMESYLRDVNVENELVLINFFSQEDLSNKANSRKIKQYQVGNPRIMCRMAIKDASAGLYFPLQLLVYEKLDGKVMVEYDLPSSLFTRFKDPEIFSDAMILENNLAKLVRKADKENSEED